MILDQFKFGDVIKITCRLAYNHKHKILHLTALADTFDVIHAVEIVIT
jgi:hypothetical protein